VPGNIARRIDLGQISRCREVQQSLLLGATVNDLWAEALRRQGPEAHTYLLGEVATPATSCSSESWRQQVGGKCVFVVDDHPIVLSGVTALI
jgi:hypothetical protein